MTIMMIMSPIIDCNNNNNNINEELSMVLSSTTTTSSSSSIESSGPSIPIVTIRLPPQQPSPTPSQLMTISSIDYQNHDDLHKDIDDGDDEHRNDIGDSEFKNLDHYTPSNISSPIYQHTSPQASLPFSIINTIKTTTSSVTNDVCPKNLDNLFIASSSLSSSTLSQPSKPSSSYGSPKPWWKTIRPLQRLLYGNCKCFSYCRLTDARRAIYRHRLSQLFYYIRIFLAYLFSTTGLCFLVVVYAFLGAKIFHHLESGYEIEVKRTLVHERQNVALELWNYTSQLNVLFENQWIEATLERIKKFEEQVVDIMLKDGYGVNVEKWSFSGALLYSVTVITTIGECL